MLKHLGIAGEHVGSVESAQEGGVENHGAGIVEYANLVFQSAKVDARLAAHRGVYHREQGGGYVNVGYAALEG